jgi:hypothetical protein
VSRRIRNQLLTLLLLDHTRPIEGPPGEKMMTVDTCELSERLALGIAGPTSMAAVDVFGQWFTVEVHNGGPAIARMDVSVLLPDGFHVRVIRPERADASLGFAFFATSPGESPGRVDCLGGALPSGERLTVHILVTTCEPPARDTSVVAVLHVLDPELPADDAIQCSSYRVCVTNDE